MAYLAGGICFYRVYRNGFIYWMYPGYFGSSQPLFCGIPGDHFNPNLVTDCNGHPHGNGYRDFDHYPNAERSHRYSHQYGNNYCDSDDHEYSYFNANRHDYEYSGPPNPSPTPTVNPDMIADFDEGGTADVTTNSLGLNGVWYEIGSTGTNPVPPASLTPTTSGGCNSNSNYVQVSGTTGSTAPVYAALQGDFVDTTNVAQPYNITTQAPAGTNAFIFCIQGSAPGNQVFFAVSDGATTQSSDNAGLMVPITGSWQSVTVCFNHMESQGFGVTTVGHMFDPHDGHQFLLESHDGKFSL